jgi:hypothetical protein
MFLDFSVVGLAPAALVVLAGIYVRARHADGKFARRWLLFLFSVSVLLYGTQFLILRWEVYRLGALLQPALVGILVALLVHLGATRALWSRKTIWITLPATLAIVAMMVYWWIETDPLVLLISAVTAFAWQAWEWRGRPFDGAQDRPFDGAQDRPFDGAQDRRRWLAYLALLLLLLMVCAGYLIPISWLMNRPKWLYGSILIGNLFVWPIVAVVLVARLVYTSIAGDQPSNWPATVIRLAVAVLLLLAIGDLIVTETVWVQAEDSLSVIPIVVFLVATAAAMLLAWAVTGWRRLGALGFALLVTLTASYASGQGWRMSPTWLTEVRAEKINRAIQRYYERQGHFPSRLANLMPFYLWRIPQPMILRDQTWCYEGSNDYYRLGYVHQRAFGVPPEYISIRIHAAVGEPPESSWPCDDELEKAKSKAPGY